MDVKNFLALKDNACESRPTGFDMVNVADRNRMLVFPLDDNYQTRINDLDPAQYMARVRLFYEALVGLN